MRLVVIEFAVCYSQLDCGGGYCRCGQVSVIARLICIAVGDYGTKNVSVIWNSEVSVVRGLLYYWSLWSYNPDLSKCPL